MQLNQKSKTYILDGSFTLVALIIVTVLVVTLASAYFSNIISNEKYFTIYGILGCISFFGVAGAAFFYIFDQSRKTKLEEATASAVFISNTTKARPLANWAGRIGATVVLTLIFSLIVIAAGSILPPPNPYNDEPISKSVLDEHNFFVNSWSTSAIPSWFEDIPAFLLASVLTVAFRYGIGFLFRSKEIRNNMATFILSAFLACGIVAVGFSASHQQRGDYVLASYILAFLFSFFSQFANQMTGLFISWVPHFFHNQMVVLTTQLSFSVGSAVILFWPFLNISNVIKDSLRAVEIDWIIFKQVAIQRWNA